jgi:hypothetical protein
LAPRFDEILPSAGHSKPAAVAAWIIKAFKAAYTFRLAEEKIVLDRNGGKPVGGWKECNLGSGDNNHHREFDSRKIMKQLFKLVVLPVLAALLFIGCCTNQPVDSPKSITFVQALHDVGQGLAEMKSAELETLRTNSALHERYGKTDFVTGLFPSEVDVTFNVTANAANANQLSVDLGAAAAQSPVRGSIGGKTSTSSSASRANQITIKFVSVLFAKTTTTTSTNGQKVVVENGIVDPATLGDFLGVIDEHGILKTSPKVEKTP